MMNMPTTVAGNLYELDADETTTRGAACTQLIATVGEKKGKNRTCGALT